MARYIDADECLDTMRDEMAGTGYQSIAMDVIKYAPTADVVEVETIKAWLYGMAINNVGCVIDRDFSNACEEILARLDGLRNFAKERSEGDG